MKPQPTPKHLMRLTSATAMILLMLVPSGLSSIEPQLASEIQQGSHRLDDIIVAPGVDEIVGPILDELPIGPISPIASLEGEQFNAPDCNYIVVPATARKGAEIRPSLRVGINDYGSIGTGQPGTVGDGFQVPIGPAGESLAVGFWGEGYLINYNGATHTFHPSSGSQGGLSRVDDFYLESSRYVTYRVTMSINAHLDDPALIDFEWTLDKEECDLTLRTTMENQGDDAIDVYYKRYVDWDNVGAQGGVGTPGYFDQSWTGTQTSATATRYAGNTPTAQCSTTAIGNTLPHHVDLHAWDDRTITGVGSVDEPTSYNGDGYAAFHFQRASLPPGGSWDTILVYECSTFTRYVVPHDWIETDLDRRIV